MVFLQEASKKDCLLFYLFEKGGNEIHESGGLRGSALSLVNQRWEAVFRRERIPASIDRTSIKLSPG
jgi:hypothetical protein